MSTAGAARGSRPRQWGGFVATCVFLALLIAAVHGPSVTLGLFMDDHAHFRQLRASDWSLRGLTDACRLDLVGGTIDLWWLPACTLRFFRPVAFGLMKLAYTLTGWSPAALHTASLLWHLLNCVLLAVILRCSGARQWIAAALAGLFAIHPAHVATVQWIACQTELIVTALLLAGTLCFARFRGWPGFGAGGSTTALECLVQGGVTASAQRGHVLWAVATILCFALALGCRENAAVFPLVLCAAEPLVGRRGRRSAFALYALLGLVLAGYLVLRATLLGGGAVPPRPYVISPSDPDFVRFVFDKGWYYLLGQFLLIPCVPIAGLPYCQAHPRLFYGLAAIVAVALIAVAGRYLRRAPGLLGLAWLIGFTLPVLPVFASPHHLYLPGIGWAVVMMLLLRGLGGGHRETADRARADGDPSLPRSAWPRRWSYWVRKTVLVVLVTGLLLLFLRLATWIGLAFETGTHVERCLVEEIAAAPRGLQDGDTLYVANLPVVGHYARLAVEERTGCRALRVIPLNWAPRLLGLVTPSELTWIDERTIEVRVARDRYFSGPLAGLIREATGSAVPDRVDRTSDLGFSVEVLERDTDGIAALRFTFTRPLTAPGVHLFWGSRAGWAYEVEPPADVRGGQPLAPATQPQ